MKNMALELEILEIKDICFGEKTSFANGLLTINKEELLKAAASEEFVSIEANIAKPGDSVRIVPVKDVIEPRAKVDTGEFFPGVLAPFRTCGDGKTKVLRGCTVVTTGQIVFYQEGIIDMSGPGAELSIYGRMLNVVLSAQPKEGISHSVHEKAVRLMGLRAAEYLARAVKDVKPDKVEVYQLKKPEKKLPRIAFVYLLLGQGLLHDNYLYGVNVQQLHTMFLSPNEFMDGAVVSGNCVTACDKNTTYDHTCNPVIKNLYERHGRELEFVGVIASPISPVLKDKERCSMGVVNLAKMLDLDGIIIAEEGGGNPESDLMMICAKAEGAGIKTVLMAHENCGKDGTAQGITIVTPEADAVVSSGNVNEMVVLPRMDKIFGHPSAVNMLSGAPANSLKEDGSIETSITVIMDAASNLGVSRLGVEEY